jgi:hypothetical protein
VRYASAETVARALEGTPAGPLIAYLNAAQSVFDVHFHGLTDDEQSVTEARGRVQTLVKVDMGRLRTKAEAAVTPPMLPRLSLALDRIEQAALALMRCLDGQKRSNLASGRRATFGPWAIGERLLNDAVESARWLMHHDERYCQPIEPGQPPVGGLRPAAWFSKATDGLLTPDALRVAARRGTLTHSVKHKGHLWKHSVAEVRICYSQYAPRIDSFTEQERTQPN